MKRRPWNGALQVTFIELQHREVIHGANGGRDGTGKCRVELKVHSLRISESPQFIRKCGHLDYYCLEERERVSDESIWEIR
jgi:hypothetical protein